MGRRLPLSKIRPKLGMINFIFHHQRNVHNNFWLKNSTKPMYVLRSVRNKEKKNIYRTIVKQLLARGTKTLENFYVRGVARCPLNKIKNSFFLSFFLASLKISHSSCKATVEEKRPPATHFNQPESFLTWNNFFKTLVCLYVVRGI